MALLASRTMIGRVLATVVGDALDRGSAPTSRPGGRRPRTGPDRTEPWPLTAGAEGVGLSGRYPQAPAFRGHPPSRRNLAQAEAGPGMGFSRYGAKSLASVPEKFLRAGAECRRPAGMAHDVVRTDGGA